MTYDSVVPDNMKLTSVKDVPDVSFYIDLTRVHRQVSGICIMGKAEGAEIVFTIHINI